MKNTVLLIICLLFLSGCANTDKQDSGKIQIYTSFYAMQNFTEMIAGDLADVHMIMPAGVEPHDWEPSARDIAKLEDADLFIYSGHGMEPFVDKLKQAVTSGKLTFIEAGRGVPVDSESDPHIWLDPNNAGLELLEIYKGLSEKLPGFENEFKANYSEVQKKIADLDNKYKSAAENFTKRDIVVSHEAYGYLCRAYGLTQIPIQGMSADAEPSPGRMADIVDFVRDNGVRYIFFEELLSPKTAETIARETGAKTAVLNPFEGGGSEEKNYFEVMEDNLAVLEEALK